MSKSIYLSPSTQEHNEYISNYGTEETIMNKICDVIFNMLRQYKELTLYRNKPTMTLQEVVKDSNSKNPSLHFAIHSNSGGGKGCEIFCHKFGGEGEKFAKIAYNIISALTPTADRGIKQGYNFYGTGKSMYELSMTTAPASLIEIAFHDNKVDAAWIVSHIEMIGRALATAILTYFKINLVTNARWEKIIQKVSNYPDIWVKFVNEHHSTGLNLKGLIEEIYDAK